MWRELNGSFFIITQSNAGVNTAVVLPATPLTIVGIYAKTTTNTAQLLIAWRSGTATLVIPTLGTFEKHFNHTLFEGVTAITPTNFGANDMWLIECIKTGSY